MPGAAVAGRMNWLGRIVNAPRDGRSALVME
jgi:hypothetical protein